MSSIYFYFEYKRRKQCTAVSPDRMVDLKLKSLNKLPLEDYNDEKIHIPIDLLPGESEIQNAIRPEKKST